VRPRERRRAALIQRRYHLARRLTWAGSWSVNHAQDRDRVGLRCEQDAVGAHEQPVDLRLVNVFQAT